jgi:uncharacterized protein (TIGR02145 family)
MHFMVYSGDYKTKIADTPMESKTYDVEFIECRDNDGRNYSVVQIGDQWWMAENLAYLPAISPGSLGSGTEPHYYVYNYYGNDINEAKTDSSYLYYGVLYNWTAAMNGADSSSNNPSGVKGVCPDGWHLPSDSEWEELATYISEVKGPYIRHYEDEPGYDDGWENVGGNLKSATITDWYNYGYGTDDFGFSGLPSGNRNPDGWFYNITQGAYWWTTTEYNSLCAWERNLHWGSDWLYGSHGGESIGKKYGVCIRCIKD